MFVFTDPVAQVIMKNPVSGKIWKWTESNDPQDFGYPFLTGVSLSYEQKRLSAISINVDIPYEEGINQILTKESPFSVRNLIQARIGYAGGLFTDWAVGWLNTGGDGLAIDANGVTGTVNFQVTTNSAFYTMPKGVPKDGTLADQLLYIAEYMGLVLFLGPKARESISGKESLWVFADCTATVLETMKNICAYQNFEWMVGPSPYKEAGDATNYLTVMTSEEAHDLADVSMRRKYVMRGSIDISKNQYPLLTWSPEGAAFATWLAETPDPAAGGVAGYYVDGASGKVEDFQVLPGDLESKVVGYLPEMEPMNFEYNQVVMDRIRDQEEKAAFLFGQPVKPGVDGKKQAEKKAANMVQAGSAAQIGVIATIGIPHERCENLCDVIGLGVVYDGVYDIIKLTHTWGPGTFGSTLTVRRSGTGGGERGDGEQKETKGGQAT